MSVSLLLAVLLLVALFWGLRRRRGGLRLGRPSLDRGSLPGVGGVRSQTRRQLLRMVGGNPAVARRLVERVQERYPNRPEQWCWEKAIYDIQRDRRS